MEDRVPAQVAAGPVESQTNWIASIQRVCLPSSPPFRLRRDGGGASPIAKPEALFDS